MEIVEVDEYKKSFKEEDVKTRKKAYIEDIQQRLEEKTPYCKHQPYNKG